MISEENIYPVGFETMSSSLPYAINYHRWIFSLFEPLITGTVLEVGFGYGQYSNWIAPLAQRMVAIDIDEKLLSNAPIIEKCSFKVADICDDRFMPDLKETCDLVVCLNILEHIEDEEQALKNMKSVLKPGGKLFILVPAHPALYGPMDDLAGHCRRYTKSNLVNILTRSGFTNITASYLNPLGGLGWFINSKISRPTSLSTNMINNQIKFFDKYIVPFSKVLDKVFSPFFGQSVYVIASPKREI